MVIYDDNDKELIIPRGLNYNDAKEPKSGITIDGTSIFYTTTDNKKYNNFGKVYNDDGELMDPISHTYQNGIGVLTFPEKVVDFPDYWASGNTEAKNLASVILPETVTNVSDYMFYGQTYLKYVKLSSKIDKIDKYMFASTSIGSIDIPDGVTKIASKAFADSNLYEVVIPDSVIEFGDKPFSNASLEYIKFGTAADNNGVYIQDRSIFLNCTPKGVSFVEGLKKLPNIQGYRNAVLILPSSITYITPYALINNEKLSDVYVKSVVPPTCADNLIFSGCISLSKIIVPMESVDAYKTANGWSNYADIIEGKQF